jgi:hypothetical protein
LMSVAKVTPVFVETGGRSAAAAANASPNVAIKVRVVSLVVSFIFMDLVYFADNLSLRRLRRQKVSGENAMTALPGSLLEKKAGKNPNTESRMPKEIRMPKSEYEKPDIAGLCWPIRPSDFGLLSVFGPRFSDLDHK